MLVTPDPQMSPTENELTQQVPDSRGARKLLTWDDVSTALDELVARSTRTLDVLDHSLNLQGWGSRARCEALHKAAVERHVRVRILVEDGHYVTTQAPRLTNLLKTLGHRIEIVVSDAHEFPANSWVVVDRQHFLFRPNSVHSNGSLEFENASKSVPYADTFQVLWEQGGQRVFPEATGL